MWISLVEVTGPRDNPILEGSPGAFTHYLTLAKNARQHGSDARRAAKALGLTVKKALWCERLEHRLERCEIEDYLKDLALRVSRSGVGSFGKFHVWASE